MSKSVLASILITALLAVFLTACNSNSAEEPAINRESSSATTEESVEPTILPPAVVTVVNPGDQKSFVLSEVVEPAVETDQQNPESEPTGGGSATETSGESGTAESETAPTPMPTFTPPPPPESRALEHFWFARPVPQGSTVWTDKAYPYGSTRGGTLRPHHGVEFNVPAGTEILAVTDGIVRVVGEDDTVILGASVDFYGTVVVIEHDFLHNGQPVYTLYGHLSEPLVEEGQEVRGQDVIALSGSSGVADGAHLHFEVRVGDNDYHSTRNPLLWLYPFPERGVVAGEVTWPDGSPVFEVPIILQRLDAPSPYRATTTYADSDVNSDEGFGENFAFDDVDAGYYQLRIGTGENKVEIDFWVYPYQTSFIEISLES
jgi:murein DD-endopeptidase MepM/ murein hydrolase activator NlpD